MCLLGFNLNNHQTYKFIFVANRDEAYKRPTKAAHFWEDSPYLLGGRDLEQMGTWLGITTSGRFAALTNYREIPLQSEGKISRGNIVTSFLKGHQSPVDYLKEINNKKNQYNGFNVIVGSINELYYYNNRQQQITPINQGTHMLSNAFLNTEWPKTVRLKNKLLQYINSATQLDPKILLSIMDDRTLAKEDQLPNTGVGLALEKVLSPIFIQSKNYGTRSTTVILVSHDNEVTFTERTYHSGKFKNDHSYQFTIPNRT